MGRGVAAATVRRPAPRAVGAASVLAALAIVVAAVVSGPVPARAAGTAASSFALERTYPWRSMFGAIEFLDLDGDLDVLSQGDSAVLVHECLPGAELRPAAPLAAVRIVSAGPNPARDAVHVRFATLPSGEARLELLDVTGRRVQERSLAVGSAGESAARFEIGREVPPGVYWLRLAQGGRSATSRIAVVR